MSKVLRCNRLPGLALLVASLAMSAACSKQDTPPPAPAVAASAIAPSALDAGAQGLKFKIDPAGKTSIDMPAPKERIQADTTAAAGEIEVDPAHLDKTRGQVKVDLTTLTTHTFHDEKKDHAQTEHAHNWLEVGNLVTDKEREANRWIIFSIRSVEGLSATDISKVDVTPEPDGDSRTVTATVKGDLFLHGHQVSKEAAVEAIFHYPKGAATGKPVRLEIKTKTPLHVILAEHDVKPRDQFGKLAQGAFNLLGTKVAETADVNFDLSATAAP